MDNCRVYSSRKSSYPLENCIEKGAISYAVLFKKMSEEKIKLAVIAGASRALALKEEIHLVSNEQILQKITSEMDTIIKKLGTSS